jgi:hypothetical protein
MKKITIIILVLVTIMQVSCKKSLEQDPISNISSGNFWKTENDAAGALTGMYVDFRTVAQAQLFVWGELRSEVLGRAQGGTVGFEAFYDQTLNKSTGALSPTVAGNYSWANAYKTINTANLLLKYVPQISFLSEATKNNTLAQAYAMRAFLYFAMVKTWGGVPIRTEPTESYDPATIQLPKSTKAEVFALIKADIDKALALYTANIFETGRNRWSKPGTSALKADVYLWTAKQMAGGNADLNIALAAINDVQTADVTLLPNYNDVFNYINKGNKEIIMASRFQLLEGGGNYFENMHLNALPSGLSQATKDAIGGVGVGNAGNSIMQINAAIRNRFTTDDQRRDGTFYEVYTTANVFLSAITTKGKGVIDNGTRIFRNDVVIYRYADILLMKAEIKNALGQDPSTEMNQVRTRAYGTNFSKHVFVNGSPAQNDAAILQERLFELTTEGKRWWDLVRFGKAFELVPALQTKVGQDYLLLFPIGTGTTTLEPLVTENTGWE